MATVNPSRAAVKQALSMLVVLTLIVSTVITEFASGNQVHALAGDFDSDGVATSAAVSHPEGLTSDARESDAPATAVAGFADVPTSLVHRPAIESMVASGMTVGCAPDRFCPSKGLSRAQMATIMVRGFGLPAVDTDRFGDVRRDDTHGRNINALVDAGFARGCGEDRFCPQETLTRAQGATILVNALGLQPTGRSSFSDLSGGVHDRSILTLADAGLANGCASGRFCVHEQLTRAQFASFLYRATDEGTIELAGLGRGNGRGGGRPSPPADEDPVNEEPADHDGANQTVGLTRTSIGSPTPSGTLLHSDGRYVLSSAGRDIWGTGDSFEFAHQVLEGDGKVVARVNSQTATHEWAKAGLMIREDLSPEAQHVSVFQTPRHGAVLQYRRGPSADAVHVHGVPASAPTWLELERRGDTFTARSSNDGSTWTLIGSVSVAMATVAFVGLAVTSHNDGTTSTAEFSDLRQVDPRDADTSVDTAPSQPPPADAAPSPSDGIDSLDSGTRPGTAFAALLSQDELAVQRDRAANGPFRIAGDFSTNSPGHWNEMAATMRLDFSSARWEGPQTLYDSSGPGPAGAVRRGGALGNSAPAATRQMAHDMMSAAYAAAITDNHAVAAAITKEIEYQATRPRLDYSNRTLWPLSYYNDLDPLFAHALWVKDLVLAYDITRAMGYPSPVVEQWFLDLAELNEQIVHANLSRVFPNRRNDSYSSRSNWVDETLSAHTRSADGTLIQYPRIARFYNNRRSQQAGFYGLVGVVLDDTRYKEEFKRYMREWVMFGHRVTSSDGLHGDVNRGADHFPQLGLSYGLHAMESLIPAMDGLARQGDTSLYEFSSSEGAATPTAGTDHYKTMEGVLDTYIKWIKGSFPAQYTASGNPPPTSIAGNAYYRIQSRNTGNGREIVNDASLLLPANYYNRTDWHDVIMRKGTPTGFTTVPQNVGTIGGWRSDWRHRFLRSLDTDPYPTRG